MGRPDKGYATFKVGSQNLNCFLPKITGSFANTRSSNRSRGYFCGEIKAPETFPTTLNEIEELGYHPPIAVSPQQPDLEYATMAVDLYLGVGIQLARTIRTALTYLCAVDESQHHHRRLGEPRLSVKEFRLLPRVTAGSRALLGAYYFRSHIDEGFKRRHARDSATAPRS
jgi:hypothetical protein